MTVLNEKQAAALHERASRDVERGQIPACTLAIARDGQIVLSEAFGAADTKTRFVVMSASKTVVDAAMWLLLADGRVDISQPVARYIPEFATHGKDAVTVEQLMTHTGGFPMAALDWPEWADRAARLRAFSAWELEFAPGSRYAYHPSSASWVIAELIERAAGCDYRVFLRSEVLDKLGLADRVSLGAPLEDQADVLEPVFMLPDETMRALPNPMAALDEQGRAIVPAGLATAAGRAAGFPGAGVVATAEGIALLYQEFLHNRSGLWPDDVLADVTGHVRVHRPDEAGVPVLRTLSFVTAGDGPGRTASRAFFGTATSAGAFGHLGLGGNLAWADPESGVSFCYLTNGIAFLPGFPDFSAYHRAEELSTLAGQLVASPGPHPARLS